MLLSIATGIISPNIVGMCGYKWPARGQPGVGYWGKGDTLDWVGM